MKKALQAKWEKLYEYALSIVRLKPWSWIKEDKLIIIKAYEGLDFYISVMGNHGMFEGIMLCTNKKAICNYAEMQANLIPDLYCINYQAGILLVFNTEKNSLPENVELAKEFMPRKINNKIITFESFVKGYFPSSLTEEELDDEIIAMECLEKTLKSFKNAKNEKSEEDKELISLKNKFLEKDENCLKLSYDEDNDSLNVDVIGDPEISDYSAVFELPNDAKEFLENAPRNKDIYEIEFLNYIPIPVGNVKYKNPMMNESINKSQLIRYFIVTNKTKKQVLKFDPYDKAIMSNKEEMEYITSCMDKIINIFSEHGIPKEINLRDEESIYALENVAKELKIKLVRKSNLEMLDDFMYGFFEHVTGENPDDFDDEDGFDDEDDNE